jgi:murein DD-endopeptidase MepM/ murein hydrolase activator NlpD
MDRRSLLLGSVIAATSASVSIRRLTAQELTTGFQYPIGWPDRSPGDGFIIRHGYACENTWYNPGYLHTGEDWYAIEGETAGADIRAIGAGEVVFAGSDYPGRVVIVQHAPDLYSMYGHLDYALDVSEGDRVESGQRLGAVLLRTDGAAPSHLHFEVRTFMTTPEVNGATPRYEFNCGVNCPPGPGYWPIDAPDHPSDQGWRNPTHVIARRVSRGAFEAVVAEGAADTVSLWSLPSDRAGAEEIGQIELSTSDRLVITDVAMGPEASMGSSARRYRLWYRVSPENGEEGWVQAAVPSDMETDRAGNPSAVTLRLFPAA